MSSKERKVVEESRQILLDVKNISKSFGGVKALQGTSFSIKKGKITALIGPNGSGKSTIFNIISRIIPEDKGEIIFGNSIVSKQAAHIVAKEGISRTFQEVRLFHNLTIREHLAIAMNQRDEGVLYNLFKPEEENEAKMKEVLEIVGLNKPMETYATDLSYGQRKLLDLAIAIAKPHHLLMLDEPVAGVNPALRKEIKKIIKNLHAQGETVLVIEHDMNFVMDLAEYVYVMDNGKVIAEGRAKQVQRNKKVLDAYLGE